MTMTMTLFVHRDTETQRLFIIVEHRRLRMTQKTNRLNDWRWIVEQQSVCNVDSASESSLSSAESAIHTSGARLHQRHSFNLFMPTY